MSLVIPRLSTTARVNNGDVTASGGGGGVRGCVPDAPVAVTCLSSESWYSIPDVEVHLGLHPGLTGDVWMINSPFL